MLDFNREDPIYNGRIGVYVLLRDEQDCHRQTRNLRSQIGVVGTASFSSQIFTRGTIYLKSTLILGITHSLCASR